MKLSVRAVPRRGKSKHIIRRNAWRRTSSWKLHKLLLALIDHRIEAALDQHCAVLTCEIVNLFRAKKGSTSESCAEADIGTFALQQLGGSPAMCRTGCWNTASFRFDAG